MADDLIFIFVFVIAVGLTWAYAIDELVIEPAIAPAISDETPNYGKAIPNPDIQRWGM